MLATVYIVCIAFWALSFLPQLGWPRTGFLAICRGLWLLPLLLSFNPVNESRELPRAVVKTPIYVFVDDSSSMHAASNPLGKAQKTLDSLRSLCKGNACEVKETWLSKENELTKKGYTPLRQTLSNWFSRIGHELWLVISDGGDSTPKLPWPKEWQGLGLDEEKKTTGVLIGVAEEFGDRLWIEDLDIAPISFEGRPTVAQVTLQRKRKSLRPETIQVQISMGSQVLLSENAYFPEGQQSLVNVLTLPPLQKGKHELELRVLAPPGEKVLWDKESHVSIEVISNTLGIMHLLGSPSWDGRFLRRYLKAEPKYDLISFFILRDPWDIQIIDERELSLIPFPVARLFNEELGKFKSIVLQNFNLLQFLTPQYQKNLVDFVKAGGSLLFLGGQRALQSRDLQNSPLRELLPFHPKTEGTHFESWDSAEETVDKSGPWFDKTLSFNVALASPSPEKLALADVFQEWSLVSEQLQQMSTLTGLHHMENVKFKADYTPLLDAVLNDGKRIPLAVASYPGKGRAIWIFSDQFWRFAMSPQSELSRTVYNHLMESSLSWLVHHDTRKPLSLSRFQLQAWGERDPIDWSVEIEGPAVRYFEPGKSWSLNVCANTIDLYKSSVKNLGPTRAVLSGRLDSARVLSRTCTLEIRGQNPAFGSVSESLTSKIPEMIKDQSVGGSELKMRQLSDLTGAKLLSLDELEKTLAWIENWLGEKSGQHGVFLPPRFRTLIHHYWIFDTAWFFILMLFLPIEVLIRRWHKLKP